MLEDIYYLDHAVLKLSYAEGSYLPDKGGRMSFTVDRTKSISLADNKDDHDSLFITDNVSIKVHGENANGNESDDHTAFILEADIEIIFAAPKTVEENLTVQFFEDQSWFFENYAHMIAHKVATSVMDETKFKSIVMQVPKSRFKKPEKQKDQGA